VSGAPEAVAESAAPASALDQEAEAIPLPGDVAAPAGDAPAGEGGEVVRPGDIPEAQAQQIAAMYRPSIGIVVNGVADGVLPNWKLTEAERGQLTDSMALACAYWFPDGYIPPKWVALFGALYTGYSIVNARRHDDGSWVPRAVVKVKRDAAATASPGKGDGAGGEV